MNLINHSSLKNAGVSIVSLLCKYIKLQLIFQTQIPKYFEVNWSRMGGWMDEIQSDHTHSIIIFS